MPRQRGRSEDEACGVTAFVFRVEQPIYAHILTVHCVFTGELPVDYSTSKSDVIIKIDISNAFNTTNRALTLDVIGGRASRDYACGLKKGMLSRRLTL